MTEQKRNIGRRNLPHWTMAQAVYFITFCLRTGQLNHQEQQIVFEHVTAGDQQYYQLLALTVMPDHVHVILKPNPDIELSRIMKGMKSRSAFKVNQLRNMTGPIWQDECWDRILRDHQELIEKANYILNYPVRAGLIQSTETYPFTYCCKEQL